MRHRGVARGGLELALLDEPVELLLDLADASLREVHGGIDDDDIDPGLRRDLSDALPHLARTDDAESLDLVSVHGRSTRSAMPSPPPMHSDAPPVFAFFAAIACSSVTRMRAPE